MQKTIATVVSLVTILLFLDLASAKPTKYDENSESHDVIKKPVGDPSDPGVDSTSSDFADFNSPDYINTVAPDDRKITGDVSSDKSNSPILRPIPTGIENVPVEPNSEKQSSLPASLKPTGPERPSSLVTNLVSDSWTAGSTITSLVPASDVSDANSLVTSSELGTKRPDNLVTILEPGSLSTTRNVASGKPGSSPTTLGSDSGRRGDSRTTLTPDNHHPGDKISSLPVAGETKNGVSGVGSSCVVVLLGILLATALQVI